MKLPTVTELLQLTGGTFKRFPLPVLMGILFAVSGMVEMHPEWESLNKEIASGLLTTAIFGFFFATACEIFMEAKKITGTARAIGELLILVVLFLGWKYLFSGFSDWNDGEWTMYLLLMSASLLLLSFSPFALKTRVNAFWHYVITLIGRILQCIAFFGILFLGIALLLASVDYLFDIHIDNEFYFDVWFLITGVLAALYFLGGVPVSPEKMSLRVAYPKALRILTEYFFVPLVSLYLIVLYAYGVKILFATEWPKGDVAAWIIGFSLVGVMTYFFAFSLKGVFQNYVEKFRRWLFPLFLPLLALLFVAVWIRISDYGVTEKRYLIVTLGVWLSVSSFYFIFSRKRDLRFLPVTLVLVVLFAVFGGPYSAFGMSENSQIGRLEEILERGGVLKNGVIQQGVAVEWSIEESAEIDSLVRYLVRTHGAESIGDWFAEGLDLDGDRWQQADDILKFLDVQYQYHGRYDRRFAEYSFDGSCWFYGDCMVEIGGYDYLYVLDYLGNGEDRDFVLQDKTIVLHLGKEVFWLKVNDETLLNVDLAEYRLELDAVGGGPIPAEKGTFYFETDEFIGKISVGHFTLDFDNAELVSNGFNNVQILIDLK